MLETTELYQLLYHHMGPQGWWPAESEIEMMLGAILVQNTNWNNVVKSLANIRQMTAFDRYKLAALTTDEIAELIRPSGYYKNKSKAVKTLLDWLALYDFNYRQLSDDYGTDLRNELLKLHGIGPETADVLLVYLFHRVEFIPDSYTRRLYARLGYSNTDSYNKFKQEVVLPADFTSEDAKEFHGLLDEFGKKYLSSRSKEREHFLTEYFIN
ncbi:endonuclease III domain-containing protein [Macrococcus equipercicus]|uniref:Endonuclease III domain-containing protein n=1 Tax=Macrococcus equipercicus TaxID=69967 RepID=A0ABQ6R6V1_9STAP|nr:endonuclease III domain-containing protein [Macrococcus equipercicus]KAA1037600.1 endonuclease III domain-containing protein [Macrococcus equipercicus]